jgi:uncharacterized C2H2 Zn-finger protein
MPKISVYKGNGAIIPVDKAKKSTGFQCPWTGKIFGAKKSYVNHLKVIRQDRIYRQIRQRRHQAILAEFNNQPSFEAIRRWVELHPEFFFDIGIKNSWTAAWGRDRIEKIRKDFWIKIAHLDVTYSDSVSNTHACPRDGVTNWGGRDTLKDGTPAPRGYAGWSGRIEIEMSHELRWVSDCLKGTGIHTGSGGSTNGKTYGYDVKFFESDWPGLSKARVWAELGGPSVRKFREGATNYFRW